MIERFGTGIRRIVETYKDSDIKPIFDTTDNTIRITLPVLHQGNGLSSDEDRIYTLLKGKTMPSSMIAKATGFGKSKAVYVLNRLVQGGYVQIVGRGRGTKYTAK